MFTRARIAAVASLTVCALWISACGANHFVQRGADLYGEGRYVEADEIFERSEPRVARASLEDRAAYAAYRGATFVALGDLEHGEHWLTAASDIERARPGTMSRDERAFLSASWRTLHRKRLQAPPTPASTAVASSTQTPAPSVELTPPIVAPVTERRAFVPQ